MLLTLDDIPEHKAEEWVKIVEYLNLEDITEEEVWEEAKEFGMFQI